MNLLSRLSRFPLALLLLLPSARAALPRDTPAAQGVDPAGITAFVDALSRNPKQEPHSFLLVRRGRVVAEAWWAPYGPKLNHGLYSLSKSFCSTAAGFAVAEGKLSLDDKVVSFFPDKLPDPVPPRLAAMRVRDLLMMSTGQAREPTWDMIRTADWPAHFLAAPVDDDPGAVFRYNSAATYMVSAIVQKATGRTVHDYLGEKLFTPLGITGTEWDSCPDGRNTGGWGLSVTSESIATFGQFLLQKGEWEGRRLLPAAWVEEATSARIRNDGQGKQGDWAQGYGYQFWRCTHGAYRGDGAFGQFMVVMPEQDAVVVITGESKDLQGTLRLVWDHLLPAFRPEPLPEDPAADAALRARLAACALAPPVSAAPAPAPGARASDLKENALALTSARLEWTAEGGLLSFRDTEAGYVIPFGFGRWETGSTDLPGTPPSLVTRLTRKPARAHPIAAAAAWKDEHSLEVVVRYVDTPHHDTITLTARDGVAEIRFQNSLGAKEDRPVLTGPLR